ncbi:MAG: hypothetical protein Q9M19_08580 [Mariprofundaceae bacterium]|nr:hypothetical protein [Mariprofundaceae bacterium]
MRYFCGIVVALGLPLSALADSTEAMLLIDVRFDQTNDGVVDGRDWAKMTDEDKSSYARMSLEAVGENPDVIVSKGRTREMLFLQGLAAIYAR